MSPPRGREAPKGNKPWLGCYTSEDDRGGPPQRSRANGRLGSARPAIKAVSPYCKEHRAAQDRRPKPAESRQWPDRAHLAVQADKQAQGALVYRRDRKS